VDEAVRSRGVSMAAVAMGTIRGISGFLTFAVAFSFRRGWGYVGHDHHHHTHHAPTWWYGVVLVGGIVGGFIGNLLGPRVRTMLREERMLTLALAIVGFAGFFVAFIGGRLTIVLVAFAAGLADGFGQLAFDAIVQRDGAEGSRARSFARYEATFQLTWVAAALLPVAVPISSWLAELVIGLVGAGAAANYLFGRVISIRRGAPAVESGLAPAQRDEHPVPWSEPEAAPVRPPSLPSPSGPRRNPRRAR
jgi:MFS family permease